MQIDPDQREDRGLKSGATHNILVILGNRLYVDSCMTFVGVNVKPVDAVHDLQVDLWLEALDRSDEAGGKWLLGSFVSPPGLR